MPYVNEIEMADAGPQLRSIYEDLEKKMGLVPHYFKALGATPQVIQAQLAMSAAIMPNGALPITVKEQIGVVVSGINSSSYCIAFHMEVLRQLGVEKPLARKLSTDYENAPVDAKVKALFRFADKLTRKPLDIEEGDAEALRAAGWDDAAIREAVLTVDYFNFVNRVSFGLGLVADF
jgi:uncharacterized peroxidase-related enzyme